MKCRIDHTKVTRSDFERVGSPKYYYDSELLVKEIRKSSMWYPGKKRKGLKKWALVRVMGDKNKHSYFIPYEWIKINSAR